MLFLYHAFTVLYRVRHRAAGATGCCQSNSCEEGIEAWFIGVVCVYEHTQRRLGVPPQHTAS